MLSAEENTLALDWRNAWGHRRFVGWFSFSILTIALLGLLVETYFQKVILPRPGPVLNDYVLNWFAPYDWSLQIMTIIYTCIVLAIAFSINKPWNLLLMLSTYAVVTWARMFSMYVFTLEAPVGVIPLTDPFLSLLVYDRSDFVKDLFFSGHVSSMCVLIAAAPNPPLKWVFSVLAVMMSVFILWQHVHYTIDVLFAPVFTFTAAALLKKYCIRKPLTD